MQQIQQTQMIWLYGSYLQITETECLQFGADQVVPMGLVQPASAVIYDYYSPGHQMLLTEHLLITLLSGEHWLMLFNVVRRKEMWHILYSPSEKPNDLQTVWWGCV